MKWVVLGLLFSLQSFAHSGVSREMKITQELGRHKMDEHNAAFEVDALVVLHGDLLTALKAHPDLFNEVCGKRPAAECERHVQNHRVVPGSFQAWLKEHANERAYVGLTAHESESLSTATKAIGFYVQTELGEGTKEYRIELNNAPQFIKNAVSLLVSRDKKKAIVVRYDWGRQDD